MTVSVSWLSIALATNAAYGPHVGLDSTQRLLQRRRLPFAFGKRPKNAFVGNGTVNEHSSFASPLKDAIIRTDVFRTPQSLPSKRAQPARFVRTLRRVRVGDDRLLESLRLR